MGCIQHDRSLSPVFDKITIRLDKAQWGRDSIRIETIRPNANAVIIREVTLGGKPLNRYRITNDELLKGGELKFYLKWYESYILTRQSIIQ